MTTLCGICTTQPSRYKCPTCKIPYCSITCFKSHKITHTSTDAHSTAPSIAPTLVNSNISPTEPEIKPTEPVPTTLEALLGSPSLSTLLSHNSTLKKQLQSIYTATLESSAHDDEGHRARYRGGRSRGSYRGRGRGSRDYMSSGRGPWTQEKGNAKGLEMIKQVRDGEKQGGPMTDFVRLVDHAYAGGEDDIAVIRAALEADKAAKMA